MNKTLSEIIAEYVEIENNLINSGGEVTESIEDALDINEAEIGVKLDGYEKFIRHLKGQINFLKEQENHYKQRRQTLENSVKGLKLRMLYALDYIGAEKIKTDSFNYSIGESASWKVDEDVDPLSKEQMIKNGLASVDFRANMTDVKRFYRNVPEERLPRWIKIKTKKGIRVR